MLTSLASANVGGTAQAVGAQVGEAVDVATNAAASRFRANPYFWANVVGAIVSVVCLIGFDLARPGSLARAAARSVAGAPAIVWFGAAVVSMLSMQLAASAVVSLPVGVSMPLDSPKDHAIVGGAGFIVGTLTAALFAALFARAEPGSGMLATWRCIAQGLAVFLLTLPLVTLVGIAGKEIHLAIWPDALVEPVSHATLRMFRDNLNDPWTWAMIAVPVLLAPIFEELVYRGMLQSAFVRAFSRPWIAILATSVVFAIMHHGTGMPWYALLSIFTLSVGLGVAFERTGRIGVPIVAHALFNAANVTLTFLST